MIKITIYPKKNGVKQDYEIFQISAAIEGKIILRISTGVKIQDSDLKYWSDQRITEKMRGTELYKLNKHFDSMKKVVEDAYSRGEDIREALDRMNGKEVKSKPVIVSGFYGLLDRLCEPGFKRDKEDQPLTESSVKNYVNLRSLLKRYDKDQTLTFEDFTVSRWQDLRSWMESSKNKKAHKPNSIKTICTVLRAVLNEALEKDLTKSVGHLKKGFSAKGEKKKGTWLSAEDVEKLYRTKMPDKETALCRDYFCMACEAGGLRFVDWDKMNPSNYTKDGNNLDLIPQKTKKYGTSVQIYLTDLYKEIVASYKGRMPAVPPYHQVNIGLKKAAVLAGLPQVTTHAGRRSYINQKLDAGLSKTIIATVTGHKTDAFDNYINIDKLQSAKLQKEHAEKMRYGKLRAV